MVGSATELETRLRAEGLDPGTWSNGPGERYAPHEHGYDKVIVVTSGVIDFYLPGVVEAVTLARGDRLELPAGTEHAALVGPPGVGCLEGHAPPGTLAGPAVRRRAGTW